MPTEGQRRAAKVRAAVEAYKKKHRKPLGGGFLVPPREKVYTAVSKSTGVRFGAISYCLTFSRSCTHSWAKGACDNCPPADHIPW